MAVTGMWLGLGTPGISRTAAMSLAMGSVYINIDAATPDIMALAEEFEVHDLE